MYHTHTDTQSHEIYSHVDTHSQTHTHKSTHTHTIRFGMSHTEEPVDATQAASGEVT